VDASTRQAEQEAIGIRAVIASSLGATGTYVDVGTNRGQVLAEAVRIAPEGHHVAFEPIPRLRAEVVRAFPRVDCRELALGARSGVEEFCHFTQLDGWSGLRRSPEVSDERGRPEYISVTVSTLDAELDGLAPRLIKIDVEGAELAVLEGGRSLLGRARPQLIVEHVAAAAALYGASSEALWDLLDGLGYRVFSVTGAGPFGRSSFGRDPDVVNWLATPADRP
jgi:FkbM family methyltransferase